MKKIIRLTENDLTRLVKRVIQEQNLNCSNLIAIPNTKLKGAIAQGYTGIGNWAEDLKKVMQHSKHYRTNLDGPNTLKLISRCSPSKYSVDITEFKKGNEFITYIGQD